MTEEDRFQWMQQTRLRQLVMDEARAWKRFAWAGGSFIGVICLLPAGILLAGSWLGDHARSGRPDWMHVVGMMLQGIAALGFWIAGLLTLVRLVRWMEAIWRRRRFSSR